MKIGDKVVRKHKRTKNKIWTIVGISNVFNDAFICDVEDELLHHFDRDELRKATDLELKNNCRID